MEASKRYACRLPPEVCLFFFQLVFSILSHPFVSLQIFSLLLLLELPDRLIYLVLLERDASYIKDFAKCYQTFYLK